MARHSPPREGVPATSTRRPIFRSFVALLWTAQAAQKQPACAARGGREDRGAARHDGPLAGGAHRALMTRRRGAYARAMNHILVTPERAAFLRQRLKEKFAELQAAKADFPAVCARLATEPRSSFGDFTPSFEEVVSDIGHAETTLLFDRPTLMQPSNMPSSAQPLSPPESAGTARRRKSRRRSNPPPLA